MPNGIKCHNVHNDIWLSLASYSKHGGTEVAGVIICMPPVVHNC